MKTPVKILLILIWLILGIFIGKRFLVDVEYEDVTSPKEIPELSKRYIKPPEPEISTTKKETTYLPPLNLILLGMVIDGSQDSFACIKDKPSGYQNNYKVRDRIKDALITKIRAGEVELSRQDGTKEILRIAKFTEDEVTVEAIISQYQNPNNILKEVSLMPDISEGKIRGFKLSRVAPEGIVERVGFKQGDVITKVNGYSVTSIKDAKRLYSSLRDRYKRGTIEDIEIGIERDGKTERLVYRVR